MLETICDILVDAYKRNWITSRDGNVSLRTAGQDYFYITPSGVRKQTLQPDQFKKILTLHYRDVIKRHEDPGLATPSRPAPSKPFDLDLFLNTGRTHWMEEMPYTAISSQLVPSGELPLHFGLQKEIADDETRVVMHLHPTYIVAAMHAGIDLDRLVSEFPELGRYTSVAPNVGIVPPISEELATICHKNLVLSSDGSIKYNIVGIKGHGVVSIAQTPWRAYEHIERLEHICKIVLASGNY